MCVCSKWFLYEQISAHVVKCRFYNCLKISVNLFHQKEKKKTLSVLLYIYGKNGLTPTFNVLQALYWLVHMTDFHSKISGIGLCINVKVVFPDYVSDFLNAPWAAIRNDRYYNVGESGWKSSVLFPANLHQFVICSPTQCKSHQLSCLWNDAVIRSLVASQKH